MMMLELPTTRTKIPPRLKKKVKSSWLKNSRRMVKKRYFVIGFISIFIVYNIYSGSNRFKFTPIQLSNIGSSLTSSSKNGVFLYDEGHLSQQALPALSLPSGHGGLVEESPVPTVIEDIQLRDCLKFKGCEEFKGWTKIPKELNLGQSWIYESYLYIKRAEIPLGLKSTNLKKNVKALGYVIIDIAFDSLEDTEEIPKYVKDDLSKSHGSGSRSRMEAADTMNGWSNKGHGLWVKKGKFVEKTAITGLDILYGDDAIEPRPNWKLQKGAFTIQNDGINNYDTSSNNKQKRRSKKKGSQQKKSSIPARLTLRYGIPAPIEKPKLRMPSSGKFKILQLSDMYFSTGAGKCMDPFPLETGRNCEADKRTLSFIRKVLEVEKPDLIVFSGDLVFGKKAPDSVTAILKAVSLALETKTPFAVVLGESEGEGSVKRKDIMKLIMTLPYSVADMGPEKVDGFGNYIIQVLDQRDEFAVITLYMLDSSHEDADSFIKPKPKQRPNPNALRGIGKGITQTQQQFIKDTTEKLYPTKKGFFSPQLSLSFFHNPLPEYRPKGDFGLVGSFNEQYKISEDTSAGAHKSLTDLGVKVISVGHDHTNDCCILSTEEKDKPNWLCYSGAVGEGGYGGGHEHGGPGFARRVRLFELDAVKATITTWKRAENRPEESFDYQLLVSGGKTSK